MERILTKREPHLFDLAFSYIQEALGRELPWLDHVFPAAERLVKMVNGKKVFTPNVYVGGNEYELITPDAWKLGNYSFFTLDEPQELEYDNSGRMKAESYFSLIVWLDITSVGEFADERNIEGVKRDIMRAIRKTWMKSGYFHIEKVYQTAEQVFRGFSLDEVENQFLMQPYCGFRFVGHVSIEEECEL